MPHIVAPQCGDCMEKSLGKQWDNAESSFHAVRMWDGSGEAATPQFVSSESNTRRVHESVQLYNSKALPRCKYKHIDFLTEIILLRLRVATKITLCLRQIRQWLSLVSHLLHDCLCICSQRLGLGVMGYPMALNLRKGLDDSHTLLICDVSTDALERFQRDAEGKGPVSIVNGGFDAIQRADTVITMLPDSNAVKKVYLDPSTGIIAGAEAAFISNNGSKSDKLIMECGTIETSTILAVAKATETSSASSNLTFVDAPVSGGPMGAQDGTLAFMAGMNNKGIYPRVKGYLSHMGKEDAIFLCGDIGAGTAFKVINNYLSAITSLAASEALNIGSKMGLDVALLTDVINVSGGQCWVTSKSNPVPGVQANVPSSRDYEGGFRIELCRKVLGMGSQLAEMVGARTILDKPTLGAFDEAMADERYKGKDARVVYKWLNESEKK